jgi:hypothetical protein
MLVKISAIKYTTQQKELTNVIATLTRFIKIILYLKDFNSVRCVIQLKLACYVMVNRKRPTRLEPPTAGYKWFSL